MFLYHLSMEKYHYVLLTIFDILKYLDLINKWRTRFQLCILQNIFLLQHCHWNSVCILWGTASFHDVSHSECSHFD